MADWLETTVLYCTDTSHCCFRSKLTFKEFVQYVVWNHKHNIPQDIHWKQQNDICQPCYIKYDIIGFYETLKHDTEYILRQAAAVSNVSLVSRSTDTSENSSGNYLTFYDKVPASDIRIILDMYSKDYEVFHYEIPDRILSRLKK